MAVLCGGEHLIPVEWQRLASPRAAIGFLHVVPLTVDRLQKQSDSLNGDRTGARVRLCERKRHQAHHGTHLIASNCALWPLQGLIELMCYWLLSSPWLLFLFYGIIRLSEDGSSLPSGRILSIGKCCIRPSFWLVRHECNSVLPPKVPPTFTVPHRPQLLQSTVYHSIFLLTRPDSGPIPVEPRTSDTHTPPTKITKKRKISFIPPHPRLSVLRLHSIRGVPNFSFQSWNMIIFLFARNINCSRRTHNHWGGKEKLPV